ncbi:MAG: hypothetical protein PHN56_03650 [Candidatus Nanoarchaeia archaeon]|nr:hypothetical protein [Candidatus Nanoarchaeia archaeon]
MNNEIKCDNEDKKVVFTAQSCKNFHLKELICKHVFENKAVPINPFMTYGYFLYELVEKDLVRNANNSILKKCDELWVYGEISNGVLAEIELFKKINKPIKYFFLSKKYNEIREILPNEAVFEQNSN